MHGACGQDGPDAFFVRTAVRAPCSLAGCAVDDHLAYSLFRPVVGRLKSRIGYEAEVRVAIIQEALGDVLRFPLRRRANNRTPEHLPGLDQLPAVAVRVFE